MLKSVQALNTEPQIKIIPLVCEIVGFATDKPRVNAKKIEFFK
jgi:hypothetical protein